MHENKPVKYPEWKHICPLNPEAHPIELCPLEDQIRTGKIEPKKFGEDEDD